MIYIICDIWLQHVACRTSRCTRAQTWADGQDGASAVAARGPRVPRVHAQAVEHVAEVQAHSAHSHLCVWPHLQALFNALGMRCACNECYYTVTVLQLPGCSESAVTLEVYNRHEEETEGCVQTIILLCIVAVYIRDTP